MGTEGWMLHEVVGRTVINPRAAKLLFYEIIAERPLPNTPEFKIALERTHERWQISLIMKDAKMDITLTSITRQSIKESLNKIQYYFKTNEFNLLPPETSDINIMLRDRQSLFWTDLELEFEDAIKVYELLNS